MEEMTNILLDNPKYKEFFQMIAQDIHNQFMKRLDYTDLELAKIVADEYQHNWLVCHELRLFGG